MASTYPIILYDSILEDCSTLTATDTETGYDVYNLIDYRSYTYWQGDTPGLKYITVDYGATVAADSFGIVGHNFSTAAAFITLQDSTNNSTWATQVSEFYPTDNYAILKTFTSSDRRYKRVKVASAVYMTYAASGGGIAIADNDNIDFGTRNFAIRWKGTLSDWTPEIVKHLCYKTSGANPNYYGYILLISTTGTISLTLYRNDTGTSYTSTVAISVNDWTLADIVAVVTRETASTAGSVVFYVDGVQVGASVAITAAATVTISNTGTLYIGGNSVSRNASLNSAFVTYNRAITAAEVLSLYQSGIASADQYGSQTAVYTSDFSAGVDSWLASNGTVNGNIDAIGGENDWLRFTNNTAASTHYMYRGSTIVTFKKQRITFTYYIPSTNSNIDKIRLMYGAGTYLADYTVLDSATSVSIEIITPVSGSVLYFEGMDGAAETYTDAGGDDVFYIKNVVITEIGATLALEPEGIGTANWQDSSSNNLDGTYPAGVVPVAAKMAVCMIGSKIQFPTKPQVPLQPYSISVEAETNQSKAGHILGSIIRYRPVEISHKIPPSESNYTWWTSTYWDFWINHGSERKPFFYAMDIDYYPSDVFWVRLSDDCAYSLPMETSGRVEAFTVNLVGMLE